METNQFVSPLLEASLQNAMACKHNDYKMGPTKLCERARAWPQCLGSGCGRITCARSLYRGLCMILFERLYLNRVGPLVQDLRVKMLLQHLYQGPVYGIWCKISARIRASGWLWNHHLFRVSVFLSASIRIL